MVALLGQVWSFRNQANWVIIQSQKQFGWTKKLEKRLVPLNRILLVK